MRLKDEEKKDLIMKTALRLFVEKGAQLPSVNEIVSAAGLAKGTYYVYFDTKEEVYLNLLETFFENWYQRSVQRLEEGENFLEAMLEDFFEYPNFMELLSHSQTVLETNIETQKLLAYKARLIAMMDDIAKRLVPLTGLEKKEITHKLVQTYAIVIGTWLASKVPQPLQREELDPKVKSLFLDFRSDLPQLVHKIWQ